VALSFRIEVTVDKGLQGCWVVRVRVELNEVGVMCSDGREAKRNGQEADCRQERQRHRPTRKRAPIAVAESLSCHRDEGRERSAEKRPVGVRYDRYMHARRGRSRLAKRTPEGMRS
jgi:hypothetical protein